MKKVHNKLKEIRMKEYMLGSQEFAKMLGVAKSTYSNWESGERLPSLITAFKIAEKLNKNINDIWYWA